MHTMKSLIITLSILLSSVLSFAQQKMNQSSSTEHSNCRSSFMKKYVGEINANVITSYVLNQQNFINEEVSVVLKHEIESPYGLHYTFDQTIHNVPVYNSQVKVNCNKKGFITSLFDNSFLIEGKISNQFPSVSMVYSVISKQNIQEKQIEQFKYEKVYYQQDEAFIPVLRAELLLYSGEAFEWLINDQEQILLERDLLMYAHQFPDSVVTAMVFNPDPLTSANVTYGAPYVDNSDADVTQLNAERVSVSMTVDYNNGVFSLESPYIKINEHSNPSTTPTTSTTNTFNFTRAQTEFEDVNAYYHISTYQDYLQYLGFTLVNYQIPVDAHALNGQDNSNFTPITNPPRLNFGEGGVDDAEDADVVLHEYTHAIQHSAAPGTNVGNERSALDEANGDYVASSYSKAIDPYKWENVFSWDGHNPFWGGRKTISTKQYPNDLVSNLYSDAPIWSSTLMEINGDIGKEKTDKILFQSIYGYAANMSMADAAMLYHQADTAIYNGTNYTPICTRFYNRGLVGTCLVGQDELKNINPPQLINSIGFANGEDAILKLNLTQSVTLRLYNSLGQLVWKNNATASTFQIPSKEQSKGLYILNIHSNDKIYDFKLIRK